MYQTILYQVENGICRINLNRPASYNAFNAQMGDDFVAALKAANDDESVRVLVISGEGKAFCSGQDLKEIDKPIGEIVDSCYNPILHTLTTIDKPIVCCLNGVAAGAGASIALACDYVIAAEDVKLLWAFVNIGLVLDSGSSFFLPYLVGMKKAFELATLGEKVSAQEALSLGMINKVVKREELAAETNHIAEKYATSAPISIAIMKRMLRKAYHSTLYEMLDLEKQGQMEAGATEDYVEGVNAFVEKRKAAFKGK